MKNTWAGWPGVPWKQGWTFRSDPEDLTPFVTTSDGALTVPGGDWKLQLMDPETSFSSRLFCNGTAVTVNNHSGKKRVEVFITAPGLLCGRVCGLPSPQLISPSPAEEQNGAVCLKTESSVTLLLRQNERFVLVNDEISPELAQIKAETALEEINFETLLQSEMEKREKVFALFSVNPRHNPPVALAAETLAARLRGRAGPIHGLWSPAEGFDRETFSLNELYPLVCAWNLINPPIALALVQTALSLQQGDGGFPAWVASGGPVSTAAPWPLIAQAFERAWRNGSDPALLKKHLPSLRKYIQWALRRFDPRRDGIPSWQSEQEVFVPDNFERGKATPEVTVLLICEIEALLRLSEESGPEESTGALQEERDHLVRTLNTVFWNPAAKAFSNVWKDGHYLHEISFGSFVPLVWKNLDREQRTALLENYEETGRLPGVRTPSASWEQDELDATARLPAIHQFTAFEALRCTDSSRALLMNFIHRAREGFSSWFDRESIGAVRHEIHAGSSAYTLGPVTAALVLSVQAEFEREAEKAPTAAQQILQWIHRLRLNKGDLRIVLALLLALVIVRLVYRLPQSRLEETRVTEAALNYQQGHYMEALRILQRYPHNPLSHLLQANLLVLSGKPEPAEELYRKALLQHTGSPSALFGLALSLQMTGRFEEAERRYGNFIDIHEPRQPEAAGLAREFMRLAREEFSTPPRWRRVYTLPMMNDLGL